MLRVRSSGAHRAFRCRYAAVEIAMAVVVRSGPGLAPDLLLEHTNLLAVATDPYLLEWPISRLLARHTAETVVEHLAVGKCVVASVRSLVFAAALYLQIRHSRYSGLDLEVVRVPCSMAAFSKASSASLSYDQLYLNDQRTIPGLKTSSSSVQALW